MTMQLWVGKSRIAGKGLFTAHAIPHGTRIIQYVGTRIAKSESATRIARGNVSIFTFNGQYDIDGQVRHNTARYINHSCDPNCHTELTPCTIWIVALRDIHAGEELTFNYRYETKTQRCHCGARNCCGYILDEYYW